VTVFESLKYRAGLIIPGAASFIVIDAMRLAGAEPLVQPQAEAGIVVGVALVTPLLIVRDGRGAA
jgi:hypothetical protein